VNSLELHHRPHRSGLFDGYLLYLTQKPFARWRVFRISLRPVLQNTDELSDTRDRTTVNHHRLKQIRRTSNRDHAFQWASINRKRPRIVRDFD